MWGVGSNKLKLPIPNSAPDGIKILLQQCLSIKPRNRPSFSQIIKHLEVVSNNETILKLEEEYHKNQLKWKDEINEKRSSKQNDNLKIQLYNYEDDLIQKRKEELKHATDIRELYEQKLEKANNLYMELNTVLLQLDERERELLKREKSFDIVNKKVVRPILRREFQNFNDNLFALKSNANNNHNNSSFVHPTNAPVVNNNNTNSENKLETSSRDPNTLNDVNSNKTTPTNATKKPFSLPPPDVDCSVLYFRSYLYKNNRSNNSDSPSRLRKEQIVELKTELSQRRLHSSKVFKNKTKNLNLNLSYKCNLNELYVKNHSNEHKQSESRVFMVGTRILRRSKEIVGLYKKKLNGRIKHYLKTTTQVI